MPKALVFALFSLFLSCHKDEKCGGAIITTLDKRPAASMGNRKFLWVKDLTIDPSDALIVCDTLPIANFPLVSRDTAKGAGFRPASYNLVVSGVVRQYTKPCGALYCTVGILTITEVKWR